MKSAQKYLPIGQAAEHFGVSVQTLRRWADSGKVESKRSPGGHRLFRVDAPSDVQVVITDDLKRLLAGRRIEATVRLID